jgi:hypothetical protein
MLSGNPLLMARSGLVAPPSVRPAPVHLYPSMDRSAGFLEGRALRLLGGAPQPPAKIPAGFFLVEHD